MKKVVIGLFFSLLGIPSLYAQAPFYQGKTITLIVGTTAGSMYDSYGRFIAQSLTKHIPGNPDIVVQNMADAGSLIAANHLYTVAKLDGLTIASIIPALYFNQLAGRKEVRFDWSKFVWIGSPDRSDNLLYMRADAHLRRFMRCAAPPLRPNARRQEPEPRATTCPRS